MMRKHVAIAILLVLILTGCSGRNPEPDVGDFFFEMPEGYAIADVADINCTIIRGDDHTVAGGIELTNLKRKDVTGKSTEKIMRYLQEDFHQTYNVEYMASHWGKQNKIVSVNLEKTTDDGQEERFTHYFFERYQCIYHIWLDLDVVEPDMESAFLALTGVD